MAKFCKCGKEISPMRLKVLPDTKTCVECSNVKAKCGVSVLHGQKDDTWVDVVFMEEEEYRAYERFKKIINSKVTKAEIQDFDKEEPEINIKED
jgi:hypothetical protein